MMADFSFETMKAKDYGMIDLQCWKKTVSEEFCTQKKIYFKNKSKVKNIFSQLFREFMYSRFPLWEILQAEDIYDKSQ